MNIKSSFDHYLKIIIVGDSGVGKTNFLFRFIDNKFSQAHLATLGIDCKSKICTLPKSKKKVKLTLWDTAGQEKYMSFNKFYFQRVQGIILMYDITQRKSYERLPKWIQLINEQTCGVPVILIGNKIDDEAENRIVREEEGKNFAIENDFLFYEASALNGKNVNNAIYDLAERIITSLERRNIFSVSTFDNISIKDSNKHKKYNCC